MPNSLYAATAPQMSFMAAAFFKGQYGAFVG